MNIRIFDNLTVLRAAVVQRAECGGVGAGAGAAHGGGGSGSGAGVGDFEPRLRGRRAARAGLCPHKRIGVGCAGDQLPPPPFLLTPGARAAAPPLQPTSVAAQTLESESRERASREIDTYTRCFNLIHDRIVQGEVPPEQFLFFHIFTYHHISSQCSIFDSSAGVLRDSILSVGMRGV